jgi:hypothetical protein
MSGSMRLLSSCIQVVNGQLWTETRVLVWHDS